MYERVNILGKFVLECKNITVLIMYTTIFIQNEELQ